jgi:hypothetical protein
LEGKRYNSLELERWFLANHAEWKADTQISLSVKLAQDPEFRVVNVTLTQWRN